jgi:uncharacterized protein YbaR (Trm112 family)
MKKVPCPTCKGFNTVLIVDETALSDDDCTVHVTIQCNDCKYWYEFPDDLDWQEYE